MQSFIKIGGAVLEKNAHKTMTLFNFNKDYHSMPLINSFHAAAFVKNLGIDGTCYHDNHETFTIIHFTMSISGMR